MKIGSVGSRLIPRGRTDRQTDRQADRHDEAKSRFSQLCELAKTHKTFTAS